MRGLHARPRPATAAVDLAALHREPDVVAAGIAGHDLHLGAEQAVDDARELIGVSGRAGAADGQLLAHEVFELVDAGAVPRDADADLIVGAADPGVFGGVELRTLVSEQRIKASAAPDHPERAAILGPDLVEPVGKPKTPGAVHVLRPD